MGCSYKSICKSIIEDLSQVNINEDDNDNNKKNNNLEKINQIFENNQKLLSSLIKFQSYYRGMKFREKLQTDDQFNMTSQSIIFDNEELIKLLNEYPLLNDNIQVEIIDPI